LPFELLQYIQTCLKLLPTTMKLRNFLFSEADICFTTIGPQKKGLQEMIPIFSTDKILRSGNTVTEANRCGIPFLLCFTHKTLLRRLQQLTYKHLMQGDRTVTPHTHSVDGQMYRACTASTFSMGFTCNQKIRQKETNYLIWFGKQ